jgi:hypothetical protein
MIFFMSGIPFFACVVFPETGKLWSNGISSFVPAVCKPDQAVLVKRMQIPCQAQKTDIQGCLVRKGVSFDGCLHRIRALNKKGVHSFCARPLDHSCEPI